MKFKKSCPNCGSDDIVRDAWVEWDVDAQRWVLLDFFDNTFCSACEASFDSDHIIETPIEEPANG